jgi:glycosyltransferase involved in cell wall biosynthesis
VRVLHAADYGNPAPGGFVPLLVALARRLQERGDAFALVVPRVAGVSWYDAVRAAGTELHVVKDARDASCFASAWRPDIAHVHFFGWEPAITAALWTSRALVLWHAHSSSLRAGRIRASLRSIAKYRLAGARVERFVAVSHAIANEIVTRGAPRNRLTVVPNAVDGFHFRPPDAHERAAARAALGLDGPAILFFGRDPQIKGADTLEAALPRIPNATLICVGTPACTRDALARHARVIAVERVDDVRPLMWSADVLALPSRGEGAPFVLLEAAACATRYVASDLATVREMAHSHAGAHFFAPGNPDALASTLNAALAAPRPAAAQQRGPVDWADDVLALYASLPHHP